MKVSSPDILMGVIAGGQVTVTAGSRRAPEFLLNSLFYPIFDMICKEIEVINTLEIFIYLVPVNIKVLMMRFAMSIQH